MFERLKQIASDASSWVNKSTENFKPHVTKWISHGRMGGLLDFRSTEFKELMRLKEQHQLFFSERDKSIESIAETTEGKPINILDIDWDKQKPTAQEHEILMCFNYDRNRNDGFLKKEMRMMANLIKACINVRFETNATQGYNHINGAVVLFCAEFAKWTNDIAKRSADEKLEAELKERIDYLSAIEEEHIFTHEPKADYAVNLLIFNLQQILEKVALPRLQGRLNSLASRELFETLEKRAQDFYGDATKGLFYLYTSDTQCQDIFELEYDEEIIGEAKDLLLATPLGRLFKQLEESRKKAENLDYRSSKIKMISENAFLKETGEASPMIMADLSIGADKSGVHPILQKEAAAIRCLVSSLGLLQDFTYFISAFRQGFSLSGAGGDILMYIGLCSQTTALIQCYCEIHERLMKQFSELQKIADSIKYTLMRQQEYNHPWIRNYQRSKRYLREAIEHLIICHQNVQKMAIQMQNVHSHDYAEKIQHKMEWFHQTIAFISQRFGKSDIAAVQEENVMTVTTIPSVIPPSHLSIEEREEKAIALALNGPLMGLSLFTPSRGLSAVASSSIQKEPEKGAHKLTFHETERRKENNKSEKPEKKKQEQPTENLPPQIKGFKK